MSGDEGRETTNTAAPVAQLENEDLLADSFRRLPALPSSLLRASLVCKRWCRVISNPLFLREFRAHHRKPPLLGFFSRNFLGSVEFTPALDPPDQIPASRFSLQIAGRGKVLHCHHGRVLIHCQKEQQLLVWDPITGELQHLAFPPELDGKIVSGGGVFCSSAEQGHQHGACHSDPFKVVVVAEDRNRFYGCVYSSETRAWGNVLSIMRPGLTRVSPTCPSTLFSNSICLLLIGLRTAILEFDWGTQNQLAIIYLPLDREVSSDIIHGIFQCLITRGDSGSLSFILLTGFSVLEWKTTSINGDGVTTWMVGNTVDLRDLPSDHDQWGCGCGCAFCI
ncbi:hypothetical protein BAE44_0018123 [Dichanthelium oligosanthes]|uniref:F-box domain-containing protein n=1 Tax=Dichanthelium oligosanthes TaxID=888268 RepID=A0A1E5V6X5_9POAL|nr:hypothetical protein BAE44_0018123 [Dichanthelium oligosanthes]